MLQLTFNPGLTLTGFRTTRPRYFRLKAMNYLLNKEAPSISSLETPQVKTAHNHGQTL